MPTVAGNTLVDDETINSLAEYVRNRAAQLAPSFVSKYIDSVVVERTPTGKLGFLVRVDLGKIPVGDKAKAARALEYGSGIHSTRNFVSKGQAKLGNGPKGEYKIEPKKPGGVLAFHWEKADFIRLEINRQKRASKLVHNDPELVASYENIRKNEYNYKDFAVRKEKHTAFRIASGMWKGGEYAKYGTYARLVADKTGKYVGRTKDRKYLFNWVDHPGVVPYNNGRGYMRLALEDSRDHIEDVLGKDAANNLLIKFRAVFSRKGGINK